MQLCRVSEVMTTEVVSAHVEAPLRDIIGWLEGRAEIVPVVAKDGRVVGVVCPGDLRRRRRALRAESGSRAPLAQLGEQTPVGELMSTPAWTVDADALLPQAAQRMHRRRVWRLPVTGDGGRLVGVVSATDLLRVFGRLDTEIREDVVEQVLRRTVYADPDRVHVAVRDGEVILAGTIERRSTAAAVARLVYTVPGVVSVVDRLNYEYDDTPFPEDALTAPESWTQGPSPVSWQRWAAAWSIHEPDQTARRYSDASVEA